VTARFFIGKIHGQRVDAPLFLDQHSLKNPTLIPVEALCAASVRFGSPPALVVALFRYARLIETVGD